MIKELTQRYPTLSSCRKDILAARDILLECFRSGGKLLLCGNGGSCADCEHIMGELMKGFLSKRPLNEEKKAKMQALCPEIEDSTLCRLQNALPAISLSSFSALNSAVCNDISADLVYAQAVLGLAAPSDSLLAISTSGNSKNVVEATRVAKALGIKVISLTGGDGGTLRRLSDVCICAPESETYKIQELHLPIYHYLCAEIERSVFTS